MTQVNGGNRALTDDEREWLRVRAHLRQHRYELAVSAAAGLYPDVPRAAGTPLLTSASWMPSEPIPLQDIALGLSLDTSPTFAVPARADGGSPRYSDLVCRLAKPAVFENRPTYRLLGADLHGVPSRMDFGLGHYFDGVDTGEALAHEYAAEKLGKPVRRFQRDAIGNPTDVTRRPTNLAISALTIRRDRAAGRAEFLL